VPGISAPRPRGAAPARLLQLLALATGSALLVVVGISSLRHSTVVSTPSAGVQAHTAPRPHEPLDLTRLPRDAAAIAAAAHARTALDARIAVDAARGFDRGIFVSSPGGALATAARVARWRPLVVRAV